MYGGPADGQEFICSRAPVLIRVVKSQSGRWDCLDQLDDEPQPREKIHLYEQVRASAGAFICPGGYSADATYRHIISCRGELDRLVRQRDAWRRFVGSYFGVTLAENGSQIADVIPLRRSA